MTQASDAALVERLKHDDEGAMREVYEAYHAQMMDFAEQMGTARADAGNVVNDVFVEFWKGRRTLETEKSLRVQLFGALTLRLRMAEEERRR